MGCRLLGSRNDLIHLGIWFNFLQNDSSKPWDPRRFSSPTASTKILVVQHPNDADFHAEKWTFLILDILKNCKIGDIHFFTWKSLWSSTPVTPIFMDAVGDENPCGWHSIGEQKSVWSSTPATTIFHDSRATHADFLWFQGHPRRFFMIPGPPTPILHDWRATHADFWECHWLILGNFLGFQTPANTIGDFELWWNLGFEFILQQAVFSDNFNALTLKAFEYSQLATSWAWNLHCSVHLWQLPNWHLVLSQRMGKLKALWSPRLMVLRHLPQPPQPLWRAKWLFKKQVRYMFVCSKPGCMLKFQLKKIQCLGTQQFSEAKVEVKAKRAKTEWAAGLKKLPGNVTFAKEKFVFRGWW